MELHGQTIDDGSGDIAGVGQPVIVLWMRPLDTGSRGETRFNPSVRELDAHVAAGVEDRLPRAGRALAPAQVVDTKVLDHQALPTTNGAAGKGLVGCAATGAKVQVIPQQGDEVAGLAGIGKGALIDPVGRAPSEGEVAVGRSKELGVLGAIEGKGEANAKGPRKIIVTADGNLRASGRNVHPVVGDLIDGIAKTIRSWSEGLGAAPLGHGSIQGLDILCIELALARCRVTWLPSRRGGRAIRGYGSWRRDSCAFHCHGHQ